MQNKPNLRNDKMNITLDMTSNYKIFSAGSGQKTKPKQTQFNPKQTQFKPISKPIKANFKAWQSQNKSNSNPIFIPLAACKLFLVAGVGTQRLLS